MAKKKHKKQNKGSGEFIEVEVNHGIWEEYLQYGPQYDTVNDCPIIPGETEFIERQRLHKLNKDTKGLLREYMISLVEEYWAKHRQIPVDGVLKAMRAEALKIMLDELGIYLKDDKDVSVYLNGIVAPTINRLLKSERQ